MDEARADRIAERPCRIKPENDPASLKLRRTGTLSPQEDPPSLKLQRDRKFMPETDRSPGIPAGVWTRLDKVCFFNLLNLDLPNIIRREKLWNLDSRIRSH